ncbi:MLO-like protein 1 [Phragmites australis]|uniref:MLO-like protein 1 n=1 Tax=Phragmites australis TaxID=29695 RepID=UPI002D76BB40|nr:MLO-like protein 1 [Phragmites australis]
MAGGGGEGEAEASALEFTPTWIVAVVCSLIVLISLAAERCLHYLGKTLKGKNQKALFEALLKVKEELMLLGFISLLLTVFQGALQRTCIPPGWTSYMLPCQNAGGHAKMSPSEAHDMVAGALGLTHRRLLAENGPRAQHCQKKGEVPLLSLEALHQLHIFIFILAIAHVIFSVLTMLLGSARIRQWKHWEDEIQKDVTGNGPRKVTHVHQFEFIREHFKGIGRDSTVLSWLHSFVKQFYGSVTKSDYTTMRLGFIMTHCRGNPKFDFHRYMVRALEADFKKVVGISWYLWIFVVVFMLLNVNGWHTYFWISFIPLLLLLAVGTKLEHVITQLAHEVAEKHSAIEGDLVVNPSDEHFWFGRPRIVLYLIHFILFQNAFEIAFFFWILTTYGFNSCIMDHVPFIVPRLVVGAIIQLVCSYSTLPLYAIVTQMGTFFKKEIFDEHVQQGLVGWAQKAKKRKALKNNGASGAAGSTNGSSHPSARLELMRRAVALEEGSSGGD